MTGHRPDPLPDGTEQHPPQESWATPYDLKKIDPPIGTMHGILSLHAFTYTFTKYMYIRSCSRCGLTHYTSVTVSGLGFEWKLVKEPDDMAICKV